MAFTFGSGGGFGQQQQQQNQTPGQQQNQTPAFGGFGGGGSTGGLTLFSLTSPIYKLTVLCWLVSFLSVHPCGTDSFIHFIDAISFQPLDPLLQLLDSVNNHSSNQQVYSEVVSPILILFLLTADNYKASILTDINPSSIEFDTGGFGSTANSTPAFGSAGNTGTTGGGLFGSQNASSTPAFGTSGSSGFSFGAFLSLSLFALHSLSLHAAGSSVVVICTTLRAILHHLSGTKLKIVPLSSFSFHDFVALPPSLL